MLDLGVASLPLGAYSLGLFLSFVIEAFLTPRPSLLRRPFQGWVLHVGTWSVLFALLLGLTGRPWFSMTNALSFWLLVVMVSNAKYHSLREPFVCADFEYFSDTLRYPRLYLPFFGITKALALAAVYLGVLSLGLYLEPARPSASLVGLILAGAGIASLWLGSRRPLRPTFEAGEDLSRFGLAAALWSYFWAARHRVDVGALPSPFAAAAARTAAGADKPDLVVVQSESFFDARRLWPGVRQEVLAHYDQLRHEALSQGRLKVSAWGANTVRTEFAFLSGLPGSALGVHRFNPYRVLARQGIPSLASELKRQGYRTICVHPYARSFYGRDKVMPALGFDEFIDLRDFTDAQRAGPFVGDMAVAEKIAALLHDKASGQPLYIHAITMENHGPLHLEEVDPGDRPLWFDRVLPEGCQDLAAYLRHLRNADRMLAHLRTVLRARPDPARLCFFGDHVPILPDVYRSLGAPDGDTEYLIWSNREHGDRAEAKPLAVEALAPAVLAALAEVEVEVERA